MRICILGAGSLGCTIGGMLSAAGENVWLVNRNAQQVEALQQRGLIMRLEGQDRVVPVRAVQDCAHIPAQEQAMDLIIVLVKSFDTAAAIAQARPLVGKDTAVLSLQNGLGHERILGEAVGPDKVLAGRSYVGGLLIAPGHVVAGVRDKANVIGEFDGRLSPRVRAIEALFHQAGLACQASDNILGIIWDKLLVNTATGALAALTGLHYGELYQLPEAQAVGVAAAAEALAVARAQGIRLGITDPLQAWQRASAGLPYEFKASMLQSLERGSRTEIDFINGAVVQEARRLGIATPVNDTLLAAVHGREHLLAWQARQGAVQARGEG